MNVERNGRRAWSAVFVLLVASLVLFGPVRILAQGEDSSLIDQLTALQERVATLEEQLKDQRMIGLTAEERCGVGVSQTLRDETVLAYKNAYGEWPRMDRMRIHFVEFAPETETLVIFYEEWVEDRWVMESWKGCAFLEASDWWDES